jgi:hypothetical protein
MTLDAAQVEACGGGGGVSLCPERGPTLGEAVAEAAEAGATLAVGAQDDATPVAAPQTPPAAPQQQRARRAAPLSGGARRSARIRSKRLKPPPARCWPVMATVDEEEALELRCAPGADLRPEQQPAGPPLDGCCLRVSGECARCSSRRRRHAARLSRRAGAMGDQEIQPAGGEGGGSDAVRVFGRHVVAFCLRRRAVAFRAPVSPRAVASQSSAASPGSIAGQQGSPPSLPMSSGPNTPELREAAGSVLPRGAGGGAQAQPLDAEALRVALLAEKARADAAEQRAEAAEQRLAQQRVCSGCCVS